MGVFAAYRVVQVGDQELHQGTLHPGLSPRDPPVRSLLQRWPGAHWIQSSPGGVEVLLARRIAPRRPERWWLHLLLLALTLFTTTLAGAYLGPGDPLRIQERIVGGTAIYVPGGLSPAELLPGLWFSLPLLMILGAHELGHYAFALRHGMDASPPYFLPAPYFISLIGTFGAFIRLRSALVNRAVLLDVGASGPIVSFLLSVPVTLAGLALSRPYSGAVPVPRAGVGLVVAGIPQLGLGEPLIFRVLREISPAGDALFTALHPMAFAGWLGFFFTALNLFPVSQLDGGHVVYALSARMHRGVGVATVAVLVLLGTVGAEQGWGGEIWLFWAVLVLLLGRGRLAHPPVFDPGYRLGVARRMVAWACIAIFVVTFVPAPFRLPFGAP